jgi:hypothetical protein
LTKDTEELINPYRSTIARSPEEFFNGKINLDLPRVTWTLVATKLKAYVASKKI